MTGISFNRHHRKLIWLFILLLNVVFVSCNLQSDRKAENSKQTYASLSDSTRYVGMSACRSCHAAIYDSYMQTGMGQSFSGATRTKSSASFDHSSLVIDTVHGYYYHPFWENDSLNVLEFLLSSKDTVFQRQARIDFIVGSGQHTNSHLRNVNGYIYQAPITYYTQQGRWDLPPGFEGGFNTRFGRKIEMECMSCHNGMPKLATGSDNKYLNVPNGIDCERCHGPGSKHVAEKLAGISVDTSKAIDYSIVNPSKLSIDLQMDVCQRCHIQGNAILNEGKSFADFRPGMSLSSVMNVFMPVYKGDPDAHIMASHAERLKMSPCFISSIKEAEEKNAEAKDLKPYKNALTCITCHNPHVSVRHTGNDVYNAACKNCHTSSSSTLEASHNLESSPFGCSAPTKERLSLQNNCVKCHMPKGGSIDIPHVSSTDHYIRKPIAPSSVEKIREFVGLACINNEKVDEVTRGKAFLSYYEKFSGNPAFLDSAKVFLKDRNLSEIKTNFKSLVHWAYLKNDFSKIVSYVEKSWGAAGFSGTQTLDNSDAWTCYRIGQAYNEQNNLKQSLKYFSIAVDLAPFIPEFRNKLASSQHDAGEVLLAKENYKFLIKENPEYVSAYTNYGFILLSVDKDANGARAMYEKALALDPQNEQALLNKIGLYIFENRMQEVRVHLKAFLKKFPSNTQARELGRRINNAKS